MTIALIILAALLPVALLFKFIKYQDSEHPEPQKWLRKGVWYGVLSAVVVLVGHMFIADSETMYPQYAGSVFGAMLKALYDAAIPEEAAKLLMLFLLLRKNPYFDEHLDGIVYATCIGLGFAGLENILYLATNLDSLLSVAVSRALFAVPGHFFFAVSMGFFYSLAHFGKRKAGYLILAFVVPVLLHAVYDGILMVSEVAEFGSGVLFVVFLLFCNWLRKKGVEKIKLLKSAN